MADFWFGNLRYADWRPAPKKGMGGDSVGYNEQVDFMNGGAFVAAGGGTHREFEMTWGATEQNRLNFLNEYRNGVYGSGLCYFVDPFAAKINAMPPHWARPELTVTSNWPSLLAPDAPPVLNDYGVVTNLNTRPNATSGWQQWPGTAPAAATLTYLTGSGLPQCDTYARATITTGSSAGVQSAGPYQLQGNTPGIVAGQTYSFRIYGRTSRASGVTSWRPEVRWYNASNAQVGSAVTSSYVFLGAGVWHEGVLNGLVAPAGATQVWVGGWFLLASATVAGETYDSTGTLVQRATVAGPYFDGNSKFIDGSEGSWTAAENISTSTLPVGTSGDPSKAATYTLTGDPGTVPHRQGVLLIPPTKTLWIGFMGTATNGGVLRVQPILRDGQVATPVDVTLLDPTGSVRLNHSFSGSIYSAVKFYMTSTTSGTSTVSLVSSKAVYSDAGVTPTLTGSHADGLGHSGLRFSKSPTLVYVQDRSNKTFVSGAASLTEIGNYL